MLAIFISDCIRMALDLLHLYQIQMILMVQADLCIYLFIGSISVCHTHEVLVSFKAILSETILLAL